MCSDEWTSSCQLAAQQVQVGRPHANAVDDRGHGFGMHVGVIAHVEKKTVQPMRLNAGEQWIELRFARAGGARFVERFPDEQEIALQRIGTRVRRRFVRDDASVPRRDQTTRRLEPCGDERQLRDRARANR